jgi:hypothetical protein
LTSIPGDPPAVAPSERTSVAGGAARRTTTWREAERSDDSLTGFVAARTTELIGL